VEEDKEALAAQALLPDGQVRLPETGVITLQQTNEEEVLLLKREAGILLARGLCEDEWESFLRSPENHQSAY
jgi:hypothetical protein